MPAVPTGPVCSVVALENPNGTPVVWTEERLCRGRKVRAAVSVQRDGRDALGAMVIGGGS